MNVTTLIGIITTAESAFTGVMQLAAEIKADFSTSDQAQVNAALDTAITNMQAAQAQLDTDAA